MLRKLKKLLSYLEQTQPEPVDLDINPEELAAQREELLGLLN